jgi:Lon protease-like protein
MTVELEIPKCMPVMTLPETVFFPQAMLPLHIFEERYRKMLKDVLSNHRIFAISSASPLAELLPGGSDYPCSIATAGIIRACKKNDDGTSNLVLQGLCRIRLGEVVSESPYRFSEIELLPSIPGNNKETLLRLKGRLLGYIGVKRRLGAPVSREILSYLRGIDEPDVLVDLAAFSLCDDQELKQRLLETIETSRRLEIFIEKLSTEIEEIRLRKKLQGPLDDDEVWMN